MNLGVVLIVVCGWLLLSIVVALAVGGMVKDRESGTNRAGATNRRPEVAGAER
jgi:glycerol-3-phosphate acyltransferase PlsY